MTENFSLYFTERIQSFTFLTLKLDPRHWTLGSKIEESITYNTRKNQLTDIVSTNVRNSEIRGDGMLGK